MADGGYFARTDLTGSTLTNATIVCTDLTAAQLDSCNGITSPTPEFPKGIYHYVLLSAADSTSSIRCFTGTVDASLTTMSNMPGMGPAR